MTTQSLAIIPSIDKSSNKNSLPANLLDSIENPLERKTLAAIGSCLQRGIVAPCVRFLAAIVGCTRQWIHVLLNRLEAKGIVRRIQRRLSAKRNDTNLYEIVGFTPSLQREEFTEVLKNKIQIPEAPSPPATALQALKDENQGLKQQLRKLGDRLAEQITFYKGYIRRGMQISQAQQWRKRQNWRPQF